MKGFADALHLCVVTGAHLVVFGQSRLIQFTRPVQPRLQFGELEVPVNRVGIRGQQLAEFRDRRPIRLREGVEPRQVV